MGVGDKYPAGTKFGTWTVVEKAPSKVFSSGSSKSQLLCVCACGREKILLLGNLVAGTSTRCVDCGIKKRAEKMRGPKRPDGYVNKTQCYKGYERGAKRRGLPFNLSFSEFIELTAKHCHYCGEQPKNCYNLKHSRGEFRGQPRAGTAFIHNGIDRINPEKGYSADNCVPCCRRCNVGKNNMSVDEFKQWIHRVYHYSIKKDTKNGSSVSSRVLKR